MIDDSAKQHRLAFAGVTPNPKQLVVSALPLLKLGRAKDPVIRISEETPFCIFNTLLVITWIGHF
jgi:hypothetical protein